MSRESESERTPYRLGAKQGHNGADSGFRGALSSVGDEDGVMIITVFKRERLCGSLVRCDAMCRCGFHFVRALDPE